MSQIGRWLAPLAVVALALPACDGDEPGAVDTTEVPGVPARPVTVPPERGTPFCQAMIDLTDDVRFGTVDDVGARILETYRSVAGDVPTEIASDFALVLDALERGVPPPTDARRDSIPTTAPTSTLPGSVPATTASTLPPSTPPETSPETGPTGSVEPDVGFVPTDSPAERINVYIDETCRAVVNNPGPAATQPGVPPADEG